MPGLLLVYAHPDDETFIAGGTIAKVVSAGIHVGLVCATRGQRGKTSGLCTIEELPAVREAELREAAGILGIHEIELLPYEDQKLSTAPPDEIRRHIVTAIRRQRPQIVISFDPNGGNLHTDHIAISRFTSDAVTAAADPRWYPESGAPHAVDRLLWQSTIHVFDLGRTANPAQQPGIDFLIDTSPFREKKQNALRAHRTQFPGLSKIFSEDATLALEAFRLASGPRPVSVPADDLFSL
jgi:LmbE family N-acetylglucosaminyl deacetylase